MLRSDLLRVETLNAAKQLAIAFQAARPFRHVVVDDFLRPDFAEAMLTNFPSVEDPSKLLNEFGVPNPKNAIADIKGLGGVFGELDEFIQSAHFLQFMQTVTGIPALKYDPWYYGAGTHENFHGAGLDPHYDFNIHPVTLQHRRLNAILYLNKDWDPSWGGSICFHTDPWNLEGDKVTEIQPQFNRCVIFETNERSWHSVPTIKQPVDRRRASRKSFTIYMYTDERPTEEIAPSHGTVYVQTGIPDRIKVGRLLTEEDVSAIQHNVSHRHEYLRQMYKREYKFSEIIEGLQQRVRELEKRSSVPVVGYFKLTRVDAPIFADGWMGKSLAFTINALKPTTAVRLQAVRPKAMEALGLKLSVNGQSVTALVEGDFALEARLDQPVEGPLHIQIDAPDAVRVANSTDLRELSIAVEYIELLQK